MTQYQLNADGSAPVSTTLKAAYSYVANDVTPVATATDLVTLVGSATKIIRLTMVRLMADATAVGVLDFYGYKRTAANTGGTATQPAIAIHDSNDAAASAVVNLYSANPTLGAGILVRADHYALPAASTTGYPFDPIIWDFGTRGGREIVLRGVAQSFAISFNGEVIPAGCNVYVNLEWTEE